MITISSNDISKKTSFITKPTDIIFIEDKKHITKSVILPYELYEKVKEKIEDELYLMNNKKALSKNAYEEFLDIETVVEDN